MASGFELVGKAALGTVTSRVKKWIDLNKQHALDEALNEYLLEELPRLHRLMEERCADLEARGCTHSEASIIAYQVI